MPITEPIDEDELEADLAAMEQEKLDEQMLATGTVPQDSLQRLPAGVNGERESHTSFPMNFRCGGEVVAEMPKGEMDAKAFERRLTIFIVRGPSRAPVQEEDDEEAELRKLQAEMAM